MKVKIEAVLEFENDEYYEEFLETSDRRYKDLKIYKDSPLRGQVSQAIAMNLCMSPHLYNNPLFSFETVEKLEVLPE